MGIGWPQLLLIALVILVLFGRGRISEMMGDFGKGISSFKKGMSEAEEPTPTPKPRIEPPAAGSAPTETPTNQGAPADKNDSTSA